MLSTKIKDATRSAHQQLEGTVVRKLKAIGNEADYADFLKYFYSYFRAVEGAIAPYINTEILPDHTERRNSSYLKQDILELGTSLDLLPEATAPAISNVPEALGALYVLEGSIMGGSIIVQMLAKLGINRGISFFSGYGEKTGQMWFRFTEVLNSHAKTEEEQNQAIQAAVRTFSNFGQSFAKEPAANPA